MSVKNKLFMLIGTALAGMLLIGGIGLWNSSRDAVVLTDIHRNGMTKTNEVLLLMSNLTELPRRSYEVASKAVLPFEQQVSELQRSRNKLYDLHEIVQKRMKAYADLLVTEEAKQKWESFQLVWKDWYAYDQDFIRRMDSVLAKPTPEAMDELFKYIVDGNLKRRDKTAVLTDGIQDLANSNYEFVRNQIAITEQGTRTSILIMIVVIVVVCVALGFFALSIRATVIKPVEKVRDLLVRVARDHDFTLQINYRADDEIGEMTKAFDDMVSSLRDSFLSIQSKMREVRSGVDALVTGAQQVADSSAQQSSSSSAMAASVEEMTVSINTVSDSANEARTIAQEAGEIANQGGTIIEQTVNEMVMIAKAVGQASGAIESLGRESEQISSVVQVIKEVADQTNLLALNAAIEAARAGEQGRGFAVVADEVRKLAERTTQSTGDISSMVGKIQTSSKEAVSEMGQMVKQVESGQTLAHEAGERIQSIREGANKVVQAVSEISNALKEQSSASHDIARHVESVAQMTDQNSAAAGDAASGAQRLKQLAKDVDEIVKQFKV
ncbi:MAG: methyl-accepting chemotaxis protein [Azoarcus sp.]|nr:methyl-accepting chemotaxis protein [Azoarcus sp.]